MIYYRVLSEFDKDEIVKHESISAEYEYFFGEEKWIRSGIMLRYRWPDNDEFGEFEEITEEEALSLLDSQRKRYNELLELAIKLAAEAHRGKVDKGRTPYIEHTKAVAESLTNTEYKIVAYLYKVCERKHIKLNALMNMGFTYRIVNSVRLLTEMEMLTYPQFLRRIRMDGAARAVKIADLKYNMDLSRIPSPKKKDFARLEEYKKSLDFLESDKYVDFNFEL